MSAIIKQIEDAMIARVKLVNTVPNFGALIKTVDRYSGEFSVENLDRLAEMCPFVLLAHTRSYKVDSSNLGVNWDGEFTVVCGASSKRTQSLTSRVGGPSSQELGSRNIAELIRDLFAAQTLGLSIKNLMPESIDEIYSGRPGGDSGQHWLSVTGITFTTRYFTERSTVTDNVSQLVEIHADWLFQPPDPMPTTLPLDPSGDLESIVQLGGS
jgi:phage gp37-like protein